jgi:hypothetical protein
VIFSLRDEQKTVFFLHKKVRFFVIFFFKKKTFHITPLIFGEKKLKKILEFLKISILHFLKKKNSAVIIGKKF